MRKREIKVIMKTMSDEQLIKECKEEYILGKNESNASIYGWAMLITGSIILPFAIVLYPLGLFLILTRQRKHTKVYKTMMKELKKRNYKMVEKVNNYNGHNTYELIVIKNRW